MLNRGLLYSDLFLAVFLFFVCVVQNRAAGFTAFFPRCLILDATLSYENVTVLPENKPELLNIPQHVIRYILEDWL